jgi:hypothetical protein
MFLRRGTTPTSGWTFAQRLRTMPAYPIAQIQTNNSLFIDRAASNTYDILSCHFKANG